MQDLGTSAIGKKGFAAAARMFSSVVFSEMARDAQSPRFAHFASEAVGSVPVDGARTVAEHFDIALRALTKEYRDEYVYKNIVARRIVLGRHSIRTATMLTELRVGRCKADIVVLNGSSTAYEIKSDLDNLGRLENQLTTYLQAFASVNVVAGHRHLDAILALAPKPVGVLCLRRGSISVIRKADVDPGRICPEILFDSLQLVESRSVLVRLGVEIPDVPNTLAYRVLKALFVQQPARLVHDATVAVLKRSRGHERIGAILGKIPTSLSAVALGSHVRVRDHQNIMKALSTDLGDALCWR